MKLIYNIEEFEWCKRSNRLDRYGYLNEISGKDIDRPASFIVIKGKTKNCRFEYRGATEGKAAFVFKYVPDKRFVRELNDMVVLLVFEKRSP